jgi:aryl-alcohol dehydrogenase-like predicted oxidoreductase
MTQVAGGFQPRPFGRTGLTVGPLGLSASYGVPAGAVERAVDAGMNYLYWGSLRRAAFADAIRRLAPRRDRFVLALQSYSPFAWGVTRAVERSLRRLRLDYADVLLLGWRNGPLPPQIVDACARLEQRGLVRHLAISTHKRALVPRLAREGVVDVFHLRYNAVHRGAEADVFPLLPPRPRAAIVSFTATSWKQLLDPKRCPPGERVPTAADCYRFVLSNPDVDVCMSGPGSAAHVDEALAGMARGPMDDHELAWMRRVGDWIYRKGRATR